jgi:hypothetical protein
MLWLHLSILLKLSRQVDVRGILVAQLFIVRFKVDAPILLIGRSHVKEKAIPCLISILIRSTILLITIVERFDSIRSGARVLDLLTTVQWPSVRASSCGLGTILVSIPIDGIGGKSIVQESPWVRILLHRVIHHS